jgi:hypothetical protein
MAELFRHTDEDGFTVRVREAIEIGAEQVMVANSGSSGREHVVLLDRDAALRLAAALLKHFEEQPLTPKES